ncbi:MAG: hypothetical protein ACLRQF_00885 [Thomasclavelia ramosa]
MACDGDKWNCVIPVAGGGNVPTASIGIILDATTIKRPLLKIENKN